MDLAQDDIHYKLGKNGLGKNGDQGFGAGHDLADEGGGDFFCVQGDEEFVGGSGGDRDEQAAGGLRVEEQGANVWRDSGVEFGGTFGEVAVVVEAAGNEAGADTIERTGQKRHGGGAEAERDVAGESHLARVADEAEAGYIG